MIVPTIGRVVLYRPNEIDAELQAIGSTQPLAAHVAYVHGDRMVNLMVIDPNGNPHARTSVTLVQKEDVPPTGSAYCHWMDYQLGQAAKTEALEAQLKGAR